MPKNTTDFNQKQLSRFIYSLLSSVDRKNNLIGFDFIKEDLIKNEIKVDYQAQQKIDNHDFKESIAEIIIRKKIFINIFFLALEKNIFWTKNKASFFIFQDGYFYNDNKKVDFVIKNNYLNFLTQKDKEFILSEEDALLYQANNTIIQNMKKIKICLQTKNMKNKYSTHHNNTNKKTIL